MTENASTETIVVHGRFQGPTGSGQGGYTAGLVGAALTGACRADFHRRIPLDTPLTRVSTEPGVAELRHNNDLILRVGEVETAIPTPPFIDRARAATGRAAHPPGSREQVPECFSCGIRDHSLEVWAGPVDDGTFYATTWTPPAWTAPGGSVGREILWAVIDCPAGAKTCFDTDPPRVALTGSMTAELIEPVVPEIDHVIVAWAEDWRGRRRRSGAALFNTGGRLLARQVSMWIALR